MAALPEAAANQPPLVQLASPPHGTLLADGDTIQLQAAASDPDGTVLKVEFYANDTLIGEVAPAPFATYFSNLAAGVYSMAAVAVDDGLARATSVVVTVNVSGLPPLPRTLTWTPPTSSGSEWNGTAINWRAGSSPTVFHPGDSATFGFPQTTVFIGIDGLESPVSAATTKLQGSVQFQGGDIRAGNLIVMNSALVVFTNYSGSLSFPGGTLLQPATSGMLTYDVTRAPNGASVHFGTGPIELNGGFALQMASNHVLTLENDFVVGASPGGFCRLVVNPLNRPHAVGRFTGTLIWDARWSLTLRSGDSGFASGGTDNAPHEWAGPVVLDQSGIRTLGLDLSGNYGSKGWVFGGNISDGPGAGTNGLRFANYGAPFIRLAGTNTYAHGTFIDYSPSAPQGLVEVAPESSLGTGDVEVRGLLRLMGDRNLASSAKVFVDGQVILDPGAKVRVSSLRLGGSTFTSGLFTATNGLGRLRSNGTFRLPAVNLAPSVLLTVPAPGPTFRAGDTITLQAAVADQDSYIAKVEFRVNGVLFGVRTIPPYQLSLKNAPAGRFPLQAVAQDDDGGVSAPSVVIVTVTPYINRIESLDLRLAVIEFHSPINQSCALVATDVLAPPNWMTIATFPAESSSRFWRVTNAVPADITTRFFGLMAMP